MSWDRGSHQRLVEGRVGLLGRWRGLFGYTRIAFPTIFDKAGDPVARSDQLRGDPGPVGGGTVPCDQITIRGKMKRVETFQVRRRPLVSLNR